MSRRSSNSRIIRSLYVMAVGVISRQKIKHSGWRTRLASFVLMRCTLFAERSESLLAGWLLIVLQCVCDIAAPDNAMWHTLFSTLFADSAPRAGCISRPRRKQTCFFLHFHSLLHTVARNQNESGERCKHAGLSVAGFFTFGSQCKYHQKMFCDAFWIETVLFVCACLYKITWFWYGTTFLSNRKALGVD